MCFIVSVLACLPGQSADDAVVLDRPIPALVTSKQFRDQLDQPISATWENVPLRGILRRIGDSRKISILLDRRIDPEQTFPITVHDLPLRAALKQIAERASGRVSIVANTVYIGPPASAAKLRTIVELRKRELSAKSVGALPGRQFELLKKRALHWSDLDRPAELLLRISRRYQLRLQGGDQVPHDLWASATVPGADAAESLSLLLIQFDLTFNWTDRANAVRLTSVPQTVVVERTYTPRKMTAESAVQVWKKELPGLQAEARARSVVVLGTIEQHDAVAALLNPPRTGKTPRKTSTPLSKSRYAKINIRNTGIAVIEQLQKQGIKIEFDRRKLASAGVDLRKVVRIQLEDATTEQLFESLCKQLGLNFTVSGETVVLRPK